LDGGREVDSEGTAAAEKAPREAPNLLSATNELPTKAPPGTDPNLWSVLTAEERAFFSKAQTMGPLTYNKANGLGMQAAMERGTRVDVKV
jgi:hypothetical protein